MCVTSQTWHLDWLGSVSLSRKATHTESRKATRARAVYVCVCAEVASLTFILLAVLPFKVYGSAGFAIKPANANTSSEHKAAVAMTLIILGLKLYLFFALNTDISDLAASQHSVDDANPGPVDSLALVPFSIAMSVLVLINSIVGALTARSLASRSRDTFGAAVTAARERISISVDRYQLAQRRRSEAADALAPVAPQPPPPAVPPAAVMQMSAFYFSPLAGAPAAPASAAGARAGS